MTTHLTASCALKTAGSSPLSVTDAGITNATHCADLGNTLVGWKVLLLGRLVGWPVGWRVGRTDGCDDGRRDGLLDGITEGCREGREVG